MSSGGVFLLISGDGKADHLLTANEFLLQTINEIKAAKHARGCHDLTPTLTDIERTHVLHVNSHFKPFVQMAFEYNKVKAQSGANSLGTGAITFSIPQFGDFFHDMVCRVRLGSFTAREGLTPLQGTASFPDNTATLFYNIVDHAGNVIVAGGDDVQVAYRNFVRYCEYPGNRLFRKVKFEVNGNPLDEYSYLVPTMLEKFCVEPSKRYGHDRLVGQEVPLEGYRGLCFATVNDADSAHTPIGIGKAHIEQSNQSVALFNLPDVAPTSLVSTAVTIVDLNSTAPFPGPNLDVSRQKLQIVNGPQTPKPVQAPLEIWNPLRFWFSERVDLAIPSVSIPYGQRFITIELESQANLVFEEPSIFLETINDTGANLVRNRTYSPIFLKNGINEVHVERVELYVNNIFVNPEIHDIFIRRIAFTLIRVFREQTSRTHSTGSGEQLLSQLKWPTEYLMTGIRPMWNIKDVVPGAGNIVTDGNANMWHDWHHFTRIVDATCNDVDRTEVAAGAAVATSFGSISKIMPDKYFLPVPTVNNLTVTSHGTNIYNEFDDKFYNQYIPYHYGGKKITTPYDLGVLLINFALYPKEYQPSGHINLSRARETYINWRTNYVGGSTPCEVVAVAVAINFLLITDGSATLRYST